MSAPIVVFDIDGTMTDYNKYIETKALPYFTKKYGFPIVNANELEIEDILDIKEYYKSKGFDEEDAIKKEKDILNKYWISYRFLGFSLFVRYRNHLSQFINWLLKNGFNVQIHSSRAKCTQQDFVGGIARGLTILQCWINGVFLSSKHIIFYKNDNEKIKGIIKTKPLLAFEDKLSIIEVLNSSNISTCCVVGRHNFGGTETKFNTIITSYESCYIQEKISTHIGKRNWSYILREANSNKFFDCMKIISPIISKKYPAVVLNENNIVTDDRGIIYASNHVRTVDPLVIENVLKTHIHWVALKRFFDGKDSIFNNSKNPILCKLTSYIFRKLDFFPVDRKSDNPKANNFETIMDVTLFLKNNYKVGIFPEGTTRKNGKDFFGEFDKGFIDFAKRNNAVIQPILLYWKNVGGKKIPIINFGSLIIPSGQSSEKIYEEYMAKMKELLRECQALEL